ncbi:MAG TPA: penicillin-binding protein 1C [Thiothrix sp.]|nr:penicillin-binding protein 1C [Thiothrix sp.]
MPKKTKQVTSHWKKIFTLLFTLASLLLIPLFLNCLPNPLFTQDLSTIIVDKDNKLLGAHIANDEQWRFPPKAQLPPKFTAALVAYEDKRFYQHHGIDFLALIRATWLNLSHGHIVSGGSTLSMQVIRMAQNNPPRTFKQKLIELFITLRLETRYSKDEILAFHAAHAPFGGNVVGLEAASWRYFGRSPEQLSWAEATLLAVLPNSPALIHPGRQRHKLKNKRDKVLKKLHQQGTISQLDYTLALTEPLPQQPKALPHLAPHLLDTLTARNPHTYRFFTTLDKSLQQKTKHTAQRYAKRFKMAGIHNLAIIVMENHSLKVRAYIGNSSDQQTGQHGEAIDLIQRPRSTGSTLKPFLFATMIQAGEILPETLIPDVPIRYPGLVPKNYDRKFRGVVRAKEALARSLNIPTANMLSLHGVDRFQALLQQMGMSTLHRQARHYGLALILGGAEGTLWDLTGMYANLAHRASQDYKQRKKYWLQPTVLAQRTIPSEAYKTASLSPASAWMTLQALLEVTRPGNEGYWQKFSSSRKIAWKTGTSFGHRDAWAIGTTPHYTVGVWVGNASGEGHAGLTGTTIAAPILFDVFNHLPKTANNAWFKRPEKQMKTLAICKDDGFLANELCESQSYLVPSDSHFDRTTPYHHRLHLDAQGQWQVHNQCENIANIQHQSWFVLPPDQAFYYQQHQANYQKPPPFRQDCLATLETSSKESHSPISLIYPKAGTSIYIPKDLDGKTSKTVFHALHQQHDAVIYWHLDQHYIGTTRVFHQQALAIKAGKHRLTLVDENGYKVEQEFKVLSK